eukprot:2671433-Amphidinium_carterae.2
MSLSLARPRTPPLPAAPSWAAVAPRVAQLACKAALGVWVGCHQVSPQLCLAPEGAPDQGEEQ